MNRKMYQLTERDTEKANRVREQAERELAHIEENADRLRKQKKYGLRKRDVARRALKGDTEYVRGLWQGRIDRVRGMDYTDERPGSSYNMGYYTGWNGLESDLRGGLVIPAEYLD